MQKNNMFSIAKRCLKIALLEIIIILAVVLVDLISKSVISKVLQDGESFTLIPKFLHFTYTKNYAAAFSFDFGLSKLAGADGVRIFFIVLTFLALGLFFYMLISAKGKNKFYRITLSLIIGGAIGNLYDRIFYGFVRDFIDVEYFGKKLFGSYHFAIFNVADSALVVGVIMLLVYFVFIYKDPSTATANVPTDGYQGNETVASADESTAQEIVDCDGQTLEQADRSDEQTVDKENFATQPDEQNPQISGEEN